MIFIFDTEPYDVMTEFTISFNESMRRMTELISKKVVARTYLHSTYVENLGNGEDGLVVSELVEYDNGLIQPELRKFKNPQVKFWVTQPAYRDHEDKKEFESLDRLDEFQVPYKEKDRKLFNILKGYSPNFISPSQRRELYQSPYVYGANISLEAMVALQYKKNLQKLGRTPHVPTTGFFDIERSLLKSSLGMLPLMSFVTENQVFLAMKKGFMYEERDGKMVEVVVDDIIQATHEYIDPLVEKLFADNKDLKDAKSKLPFKYNFFVGDTEVEMIKWIFSKMHETKVSFIGIWNLGFDIPEIIKVLKEADVPLEEVFSHPDLRGTGWDYAAFREDKRKVHHFTQKWHWLSACAHFQFVDSMALYSYIRTVVGKEASYKLDDILKNFDLGGKLKIDKCKELDGLQEADWHRAMLSRFFVPYALYAMWDSMSLQLLEWRNNDLTAMMLQSDITPPKFFPNQTISVTNTFYQDWLPRGYVFGTGVDVEAERDDDLLTAGGAVLEPQNLVAQGLCLFKEWPSHRTHCYAWQNDFDFSAQYPTNIIVLNISKQTKIATMFAIKGDHVTKKYDPDTAVEVLCSYLITPKANGVELGTEFFNLPDYTELSAMFEEHLRNKN